MMQTFIAGRDFSRLFSGSVDISRSGSDGKATVGRDMIRIETQGGDITYVAADQILDVETPEPIGGWKGRPSVTVER